MRLAGRVTLLRRDDLLSDLSARGIRREREEGRLFVVRPGVFARRPDGDALTPEEKMLVRAVAWDWVADAAPVVSHLSAAAAHGLPVWGPEEARVHVIVPEERPGRAAQLVRHRGALADDDVVLRHGMRVTSLERTVADVARTAAHDTAVAVADAGMRACAFRGPGDYDERAAEGFRARCLEIARRSAHGAGRATRVLRFADGRSQLPGESVSRVRLHQLGFAPPDLQVPVAAPGGRWFWIDFGLRDISAWGEFDGKGKYRDALLRGGLTPDEVLEKEKEREDWIRGTTGRPLVRWRSAHISTPQALAARLGAFGVVPPPSR